MRNITVNLVIILFSIVFLISCQSNNNPSSTLSSYEQEGSTSISNSDADGQKSEDTSEPKNEASNQSEAANSSAELQTYGESLANADSRTIIQYPQVALSLDYNGKILGRCLYTDKEYVEFLLSFLPDETDEIEPPEIYFGAVPVILEVIYENYTVVYSITPQDKASKDFESEDTIKFYSVPKGTWETLSKYTLWDFSKPMNENSGECSSE